MPKQRQDDHSGREEDKKMLAKGSCNSEEMCMSISWWHTVSKTHKNPLASPRLSAIR